MRQALVMILMGGIAMSHSTAPSIPLNTAGYDPAFAFGKSFLDPRRLHMDQSLSFGFSSGSLGRQSGGLYLNRISLDLSRNLQLQVDLGMSQIFTSSSPQLIAENQKPQMLLPRIGLEYKSQNFTLGIHYMQMDRNSMPSPYLLNSRFGGNPW